jgi:hypothetical protein
MRRLANPCVIATPRSGTFEVVAVRELAGVMLLGMSRLLLLNRRRRRG